MSQPSQPPRKVIPLSVVESDGPPSVPPQFEESSKIYPKSVTGRFNNWRWALVWLTQLVFYGMPWLHWGQRQAVLFDLESRRFYLFGLVLYPQDLIYLTGLLVICALALFLFTAVAGRLWCGYACPQTVYSEIYLWLEKITEGDRAARMRRDAGPWGWDKLWRKSAKQALWVGFGLWTGFTFVGYFTTIQVLAHEVAVWRLGPWEIFWILFYGFATYGNAGYLREKVCLHMCPYARFQSVMFDRDTLVVTYDAQRGEPRGARSKKADPAALGLGSCVDCTLCVQVCPTGIDIRNGLQYQCIGCGLCADACNNVMDKVGYPRGLIRYATENAIEQGWGSRQVLSHVLRPRVLIYSTILLGITLAMFVSLGLRTPFKVDVVRDRGVMARIADNGNIENVYRVQLMNASENVQRYRFEAQGLPGLAVQPQEAVEVGAAQSRWVVLQLQVPPDGLAPGSSRVRLLVRQEGSEHVLNEPTVFLAPR
ncbi:MAG: cytochrome c oxidase accessory protein CcoG [Rhodoferax sp.]